MHIAQGPDTMPMSGHWFCLNANVMEAKDPDVECKDAKHLSEKCSKQENNVLFLV
jgi:hypothetical protein